MSTTLGASLTFEGEQDGVEDLVRSILALKKDHPDLCLSLKVTSEAEVEVSAEPDPDPDPDSEAVGTSINDLDLTERPRNCLKRVGITTIEQLTSKTEDDLRAITNFGERSLEDVVMKLAQRGLKLLSSDLS